VTPPWDCARQNAAHTAQNLARPAKHRGGRRALDSGSLKYPGRAEVRLPHLQTPIWSKTQTLYPPDSITGGGDRDFRGLEVDLEGELGRLPKWTAQPIKSSYPSRHKLEYVGRARHWASFPHKSLNRGQVNAQHRVRSAKA
jgi:hypothetical protein